jgi:hypothetical protein
MESMRVLLALAPLLLATTAYAQAPGEMPPTYAQPPPPVAPVGPPGDWAVMATRLSVGLSFGQATVTDQTQTKTDFSIGEVALRYRLRPEWEAEAIIGGGREKLADGSQGDRQLTEVTLGLRYRFRPADQLNWFLAAGVGASAIASQSATSDQQDAATRPHAQFGGGVEYRFAHLALQAELRVTAMGQPKGMTTAPALENTAATTTSDPNDTMTSGQVTIGASYYF